MGVGVFRYASVRAHKRAQASAPPTHSFYLNSAIFRLDAAPSYINPVSNRVFISNFQAYEHTKYTYNKI